MEFTSLGRTGLRVSVMGLGCGGHSRLGLSTGSTDEQAQDVVRAALDLGVNFIDTAESYRTEETVGRALKGRDRSSVVISTKASADIEDGMCTAAEMRGRVEACLERLQTDYIDLFNLHALIVDEHAHALAELVPLLQKMRDEGKIRFIGVTEQFIHDTSHEMLKLAAGDGCWDVVMVGFSILNQSARKSVFPWTTAQSVGTLGMFAVRRALSQPARLIEAMADLASTGLVDPSSFNPADPLDFLVADGIAESVQDAAYRFCRWEPGMDVVLSGTGNIEHLRRNAASLSRPPLPSPVVERLTQMLAKVDSVSGN